MILSSNGKYIPTTLNIDALSEEDADPREFGKLSKERQIQCYQGIGEIFAKTLYTRLGGYEITTGTHFHESTFSMMHALTEEDLLIKKLLNIFLKTNYFNLFSTEDDHGVFTFIGDAALSEEINDLLAGRISDRLVLKGIDEEYRANLLQISRNTIEAIIIITKSIKTRLEQRIDARIDLNENRWDRIKGADSKALGEKIEGKLTKEMAVAAFNLQRDDFVLNQQEKFLKQWINEASFEDLEKLVWATTGSKTLLPNQRLNLHVDRALGLELLPVFHTCAKAIDWPAYTSYEMCKERLRVVLSHLGDSFDLR